MLSLCRKGIILVVSCSVRKWSATTKMLCSPVKRQTGHFAFPQGNSDFVAGVRRTAQNVLSYIFRENITVKIRKISSSENRERSTYTIKNDQRSGRTTTYFTGHDEPKIPELKWFSNDDNIKGLIEMRFAKSVQSKTLILEGSSSATMSQQAAYAIDCVVGKMGNRTKLDMKKEAVRESSNKLIFEIQF